MMNKYHYRQWMDSVFLLLAIVLIVTISRWLPHPPNLTAVGAVGLFIGSRWRYTGKAKALLFTMAALLISDALIGFYDVRLMAFVYAASLLSIPVGGLLLTSSPSLPRTALTCLLGATLFFLLSNFGWWMVSGAYPMTLTGLGLCYLAAIPFFSYSLLGNLIYLPVFLLVHRVARRVSARISPVSAPPA